MKKLLFLSVFFISAMAFAQENISLVHVTGEGAVKVVPDEVTINARVEHSGDSAAVVKKQNETVVNAIFEFLKEEGVPTENIQTEYLRLNKQYNYDSKEYYYSADQAVSIKLDALENYEKIMSGLMNSGLNRIDGIEFQSSKKEELESEARKKAMLNAQEKAKQLASALGQKIGRAHTISELESNHYQPVYRMSKMTMADSAAQQTIAPGEMEITVKVNVKFLLEE